jgi:hypothetical protein
MAGLAKKLALINRDQAKLKELANDAFTDAGEETR